MANGFREFERRVSQLGEKLEQNVQRDVIKAALVIDQVVVLATPVDTGRARANWIVALGHPSFGFREKPASASSGSQEALQQGREVISSWTLDDGPIYISNNLDYIDALDKGHSAQAPNGMTAQALSAGSAYLRARASLLRGGS